MKPFEMTSLEQIKAARSGQPFLLVLWSVDCPPCIKELSQLRSFREEFGARGLVLLSTDGPMEHDLVIRTIAEYGLQDFDNWAFSDNFADRLRYSIDPAWYGELPRAYFYDADHQRLAVSGMLSPEVLETWIKNTADQTASGQQVPHLAGANQ